ncbi:MAG: matrixin family metalloprotease [Myxococcota bacterium]
MRLVLVGGLLIGGLGGAACDTGRGGWSLRTLEAQYGALGESGAARLADATPYFLPSIDPTGPQGEALLLFLCRFPTTSAIAVSLPANATHSERAILRRALRAWEGALRGLRFEESMPARARITIRIVNADRESATAPRGSADTIADCALPEEGAMRAGTTSVAAQLASASIYLRRTQRNSLGQAVAFSPEEFAGAVLHELGHALGFQGHVRSGLSVMVRNVEKVRRIGARVLSGEPLLEGPVRALYALPPGVVVGRLPLPSAAARTLRHLHLEAQRNRWAGPFVRVGDQSARLFWRDSSGGEVVLGLRDWAGARRRPADLSWLPNRRARELLERRARELIGPGTSAEGARR